MNPGDVVGPGGSPDADEQKHIDKVEEPKDQQELATQEPAADWKFTGNDDTNDQDTVPVQAAQHDSVTWTASEYIAHERSAGWYGLLALAVVVLALLVYFITRELISAIVIVIMGIAFGSFAARKPQELAYVLSNTALKVGERSYPYAQFKSFTIVEDEQLHAIMLMPLQRFMPPLSVYFDPSDEEKITAALSSYLPYEDRKQDLVDRLMRKVRF